MDVTHNLYRINLGDKFFTRRATAASPIIWDKLLLTSYEIGVADSQYGRSVRMQLRRFTLLTYSNAHGEEVFSGERIVEPGKEMLSPHC